MKMYGKTGVYKVHLFGNPSVVVTTPGDMRKRPAWLATRGHRAHWREVFIQSRKRNKAVSAVTWLLGVTGSRRWQITFLTSKECIGIVEKWSKIGGQSNS
ncbi:hypothetical protein SDJN02_20863, partial [Cucurbita argyrosperma subsp. argyrosperma]